MGSDARRALREWTKVATDQGWTVRLTGSKHWRFTSPHGRIVVIAGTSGGGRGQHNARAALRRAGLVIR